MWCICGVHVEVTSMHTLYRYQKINYSMYGHETGRYIKVLMFITGHEFVGL